MKRLAFGFGERQNDANAIYLIIDEWWRNGVVPIIGTNKTATFALRALERFPKGCADEIILRESRRSFYIKQMKIKLKGDP